MVENFILFFSDQMSKAFILTPSLSPFIMLSSRLSATLTHGSH